jgi:Spy/CpxP family protein refolding chaperone
MASALKLTDVQRARVQELLNARDAELKEWDEKNGAKLAELRQARKDAKETDKTARAKAQSDLTALSSQREAIETKYDGEFQAALTPEQRWNWEGYRLYQGAVQRFRKVNLTEAQKTDIRKRATEAGANVTRDEDGKSKGKARQALWAAIEKEVLTPEQRTAMTAKPEKGGDADETDGEAATPATKPGR